MLHAVIMAGGAGTRFWPESRAARPKQLLNLAGERTMLQATLDRLGGLVPPDRTMVVTAARLTEAVREQLPELPASAIVGEPCKRDTAPCIGLAAMLLLRGDPEATMIVMPSDHVIEPIKEFQRGLAAAAELVDAVPRRIATFGIAPTYPAESFGYIERGEVIPCPGQRAYQVRRFREKPSADVAREFLAAGNFLWNSGIFVWKARTILDELQRHQPEMAARLSAIASAWRTPEFETVFPREFAAIRGVSIDYAVMENAPEVVVVEAAFRWDDVGSWQSIARLNPADEQGNTIQGRHLGIGTTGSIVRSEPNHLIVTLGLEDCIVVHTRDATLVARKRDEESIRQVVKQIEERGWSEFL